MAKQGKPIAVKETYCNRHRCTLPVEEFYKTNNPNHGNGYLLYCKKCTQEIMAKNLKDFGNLESALWYTCAQLDMPFIRKVYERVDEKARDRNVKNTNYIGIYITNLNTFRKSTDRWETFADTDVAMGEVSSVKDLEVAKAKQIEELQMIWGDDLEFDDIQYLEYRFTTYTKDMELDEYQAGRYRDLCMCELKIKNNEDAAANMKLKPLIAKELGLDQFKISKEKSDIEKIIENDIYMMEKYEPAEYYADKELYKDHFNIHSYYVNYILRPIKNLVTGSKDYEIKEDSKYGEEK